MPHTLHTSEKVNTRTDDGTINCVKIQMKDIESSAADHFVFIRECANLCARLRSHLEDELGGEKQKLVQLTAGLTDIQSCSKPQKQLVG